MKLRIIAGSLRGRSIAVPARDSRFRPTLERHRESLLQIITPRLDGARAVDLCAGSGAVGFEMLSRGAAWVDFVESDRNRARHIRENACRFGVDDRCRVMAEDVRRVAKRGLGPYDILYYDPPYADEALAGLLPGLFHGIGAGGILLYEHQKTRSVLEPDAGPDVVLTDSRDFGIARVAFYSRSAPST